MRELGGTPKLVGWLNKLVVSARASEVKKVIGNGRLIETTDGKTIEIWNSPPRPDTNPFRIYQSGDWLHYKVTTGWVVRGGVPILATNIETELPITASVLYYWFYMELTDTTAVISTSATTLAWSCTKIPLGWVDTLTGVGTNTPSIVNLNRDHLFNPL